MGLPSSPLNSARSVHNSQRAHRSWDSLGRQREALYAMAEAEQQESSNCMSELEQFDARFRKQASARPRLADSSRRSLPLTLPTPMGEVVPSAAERNRTTRVSIAADA